MGMSQVLRRCALAVAAVFAMTCGAIAISALTLPAVSWACDGGQVWDPGSNACQWPAPPPPPPPPAGPVSMCIGAPVPFVPMSWCFPVGGGS
jgi:hypothetical protein